MSKWFLAMSKHLLSPLNCLIMWCVHHGLIIVSEFVVFFADMVFAFWCWEDEFSSEIDKVSTFLFFLECIMLGFWLWRYFLLWCLGSLGKFNSARIKFFIPSKFAGTHQPQTNSFGVDTKLGAFPVGFDFPSNITSPDFTMIREYLAM